MTLDKAIEELTGELEPEPVLIPLKGDLAKKLGIEALKCVIAWRNDNAFEDFWDFPGETME